jgi:membrane protease YdiL (CAAX protease family)
MASTGIASGHRQALGVQAERLAARADLPGVLGRKRALLLLLAAYAAMCATAALVALTVGINPMACEGWLHMQGAAAALSSLGLGVCAGAGTIAATRTIVRRTAWARALHDALRPSVHGAADSALVAVAVASAVGEELLFRGVLVPLIGVAVSSVVFGALHQIRGHARWWWMAWATAMGLVFGALFAATGSLVGPVVAHAAINAANLRYLRDNELSPRRRPLGGLLQR